VKFLERISSWARRIKHDSVTLWFACKSPHTPWYAKAVALITVAYALSPIDLIPDFIPVLGYLDDAILLPGLIWLAVRLIPVSTLALSRAQADEWIRRGEGKPRSYLGASVIVVLWCVFAYWLWTIAKPYFFMSGSGE
jgi:uncharacterized membrane protein YkvA (DUF1232 family)